ncbi:MAG TPA: hypothetical protein IAB23_04620 [Candidatus Scybalocola faecavium]|nr:hypothetical protein [Candidatus Scybalocola faecavium]
MADLLEINVSALSSDIQSLEGLISSGTSDLGSLKESIENLSSTWSGLAHDTFYEQVSQDLAVMEEVFSSLQAYKEHMEYAVKEYNQCEQDVYDMVASIPV